mgnify:CR=1 FL=1
MIQKIANFKSLSALSFIAVVTIYPVLTLPAMIGLLMDHAQMTSFSAGWAVAIGTFSTATAGFIMSMKIDKQDIKLLCRVSLIIATVMDLLSAFTVNMIIIFFLVRIVWGLAMGVAHASSISSIAHYENFKDGFGLYVGLQFIVSGLGLYLVPVYSDLIGVEGFFVGFVMMDLIALYLTKFLQNTGKNIEKNSDANSGIFVMLSLPALLAIIGFTLFEAANTSQFSYIERFGVVSSLSEYQIGFALLVGSLLGIPGGLSIFLVGERFGLVKPLAFGILISISALVLLLNFNSYPVYFVTSCMLGFSWAFCMPFIESLLARIDRKGRVVAAGSSVSFFGSALGPGFAAIVVFNDQYRNSFLLSICLFLITLIVFLSLKLKTGKN